jgi:hypothetical protein
MMSPQAQADSPAPLVAPMERMRSQRAMLGLINRTTTLVVS